MAKSEEPYMECFVALILAIVFRGHSLNSVQRSGGSDENKFVWFQV
jgi:hypothetical protein